jgi:hypothetical protein
VIKKVYGMTSRPGKCKLFSYKFRLEADRPVIGYSRPIPFALRPAVRSQIDEILKDDIFEIVNSHFFEPFDCNTTRW